MQQNPQQITDRSLELLTLGFSHFAPLQSQVGFAVRHGLLTRNEIGRIIDLIRAAAHELAQHLSTVESIGPMREADEAFTRLKAIGDLLRVDAKCGRLPPETVDPLLATTSRLLKSIRPFLGNRQ